MDASMMMMMAAAGVPVMPMSDDLKTPPSMDDPMSMMTRMKSRAQSAHEMADVKMKMHLRAHTERPNELKAPCKHSNSAALPQLAELAAPRNEVESQTPCKLGHVVAAPAVMEMKPMLSQPLTQMSPMAMPNGAMSAPLMAPQMVSAMPMSVSVPMPMPMMQHTMQAPATSQRMMPMMASGAFPQNVVALDGMSR